MKKLKQLWFQIPKPVRVLLNALAVLIVSVTFYVCIGSPTFSEVQAFRREEQANLLGPSTILFNERVENYPYGTNVILAETDNCVITWVEDEFWGGLNYHEKTGDITLVTAPAYWFDFGQEWWDMTLPVFLVDDYPVAVRADIILDIQGVFVHNLNGEQLEESLDHRFSLSAHREEDGFFWFPLSLDATEPYMERGNVVETPHGANGYALDALADTFTNKMTVMNPQSNVSITATVQLYDEQENLVVEKDLVLRSTR